MNNLEITERRAGVVTVLDLRGNIRLGAGNIHLHKALRALVDKGEKRILINLADVTHIDSSGLGELVAGYTTLQKSGGDMKLLKLTERVRELMVITKLLTVFDVFDDEQEAIGSFETVEDPEVVNGPLEQAAASQGDSK
ncbi:MAG: STAS domain-containing protein [Acidobacteria bacterium]|nr:STAS domain-containing protein [Acidobacteriota bacterium]